MEAFVSGILGILDVILYGNNTDIILPGQHISYPVYIGSKRTYDSNTGNIIDIPDHFAHGDLISPAL